MRTLAFLGLALGSACWPSGPALACQTTDREAAQERAQRTRDQRRADVVVVGTLQIGEECKDWGQRCLGRLTVAAVQRGDPAAEFAVRFEATSSMCDGRFLPRPDEHTGLFYLSRDVKSDAYMLVDFERTQRERAE